MAQWVKRARARETRRRSPPSRSRRTCPRSGATHDRGRSRGYHDVHLTERSGAPGGLAGRSPATSAQWVRRRVMFSRSAPATVTGSMPSARRAAWRWTSGRTSRSSPRPASKRIVLDARAELPTLGARIFDVALASNVLEHFRAGYRVHRDRRDRARSSNRGGRLRSSAAELPVCLPQLLRRLHASLGIHRRVAVEPAARAWVRRSSAASRRFLPYSMREYDAADAARGWSAPTCARRSSRCAGQMLIVATQPT